MNAINKALRFRRMQLKNPRNTHAGWRLFLVGFLREVTGKNLRDFRWVLYFPFNAPK